MQKKLISSIGLIFLSLLLPNRVSAQLVIAPSQYVSSGGGTGPLHCLGDGTALLPCYTGSTVNSGIYFSTTSTLISANGSNVATFSTTLNTFVNTLLLPTGNSTTPAIAIGASNYGWYLTGTTLSGTIAGTTRLGLGSGSLAVTGISIDGSLSGLATTSTDGATLTNTTAATSGVPVQISPRIRLRGTAWDTSASETVDFFLENLPATAATPTGTLKFGYSLNGAAATYPMTLSSVGTVTFGAAIVAGSNIQAANTGIFLWDTRTKERAPADALLNITDNAAGFGLQINAGTAAPTVANCSVGTAGAVTAHSSNTAGKITPGTGSTSCDVVFGSPAFTNAPFPVITPSASTVTAYISAVSTTGFTVSGLAAGEAFTYVVIGGI